MAGRQKGSGNRPGGTGSPPGRPRSTAGGGRPGPPASGRHGPAASRRPGGRAGTGIRPSGLTAGVIAGVVLVVAAVIGINLSLPSPVHRDYLASLASAASGRHPVNGITCAAPPRLSYHWHAHVAIYVDGTLRSIPAGVGIGTPRQTISGSTEGPCTYPVHTHTPDGILHIESPTSRLYTLGTFFAVWHQPLSPTRVGPVRGPVTVLVNGKPYHGSPARVVLREHELIQLDVGTPAVPFRSFTFPSGL